MRIVIKLIFYIVTVVLLCWLVRQIAVSFNRATAAGSTSDASQAYALFSVYLLVSAALAMFLAWDVSQFLGMQAGRLYWGGGRVATITPAWWKSERLCKEGRPIEAIEALREYQNAHPHHWRVAVRIAEIYQHETKEPLPAALEYEQILKGRLPQPARAEILLRMAACCLLLRDVEKSATTLRKVINEFQNSPAAEKAVRRLARMENPSA